MEQIQDLEIKFPTINNGEDLIKIIEKGEFNQINFGIDIEKNMDNFMAKAKEILSLKSLDIFQKVIVSKGKSKGK